MENTDDNHEFGKHDYHSADDYLPGQVINLKMIKYLGRRQYSNPEGTIKTSGFFMASDASGKELEFRLGLKNEVMLARKYGIKNYKDLEGRTLGFFVKQYRLGNGFVINGIVNQKTVV